MDSRKRSNEVDKKPSTDSVFRRHRKKTIVLINLVVLLLLGLAGELILRLMGQKPHPTYFQFVDTLEVYNDYVCDEKGIAKLNPAAEFADGVSVNEEGFRDQSFAAQLASDRPRIMFVGDSFTYGVNASPITNCFADRIERYGYTAFNFGITGIGPAQYAAVVEKYLPVVKPDLLAVMVFLGNDVNSFSWKVQPHQLPFHSTNVGLIYAYDQDGNRMTAAQAYKYYYGGLWMHVEYYARKSVLLCFLGRRCLGLRNRILMGRYRKSPEGDAADINQYAIDRYRKIDAMARAQGVPCRFFIIPTKPSHRHSVNRYEHVAYVFEGLETAREEFEEEDYAAGADGHFNNAGHEKMTQLVRRTLEQLHAAVPDRP